MKYKTVKCDRCFDWDQEKRFFDRCNKCNNSGIIIDPNEMLCNMCGDSLVLEPEYNDYPLGIFNYKYSGSYFSYHLFDCTTYTFNLCEKCMREIFNNCKIKPVINGIGVRNPISYENDKEEYDYRVWLDDGGFHNAYKNGKCNRIKDCPNDAIYSIFDDQEFTENCSCEDHKDLYFSLRSELKPFIKYDLKAFM